ncbi:hypothetical protein ES702_02191 [subsurface metagenome]
MAPKEWAIGASEDDCRKYNGNFSYTSSSIFVGRLPGFIGKGAWRWRNVNIPKGAQIISAYLKVYGHPTDITRTLYSAIYGIDEDNTSSFTTDPFGRVKTTAKVDWDDVWTHFTDSWESSPDISAVIQEIINRPGWASGNTLGLFWEYDGPGTEPMVDFDVYSFNHPAPAYPAILMVTWSMPTPTKGTVNVYALAGTEGVEASFIVNQQGPYTTPHKGLQLDPGTYKFVGSYNGQTDTQIIRIITGANPDVTFHFSVIHTVTITSEPSPINFTLDGDAKSTPLSIELVSGTYTLVMPSRVMVNLDEYIFEQWENGSKNRTRTVTLASPEFNFVATYRLRQIDEAGPINQRQAKDTLQEVFGEGADLSDTNPLPTKIVSPLPLPTEDTGTHSNPEKYVQDHKFSSWPIDRAGAVATLLYGVASPAAHRRTAGRDITVWWIYFYNHSGGAATVWLESPLGTVITATVQLANNQGVMLNVKPLDVGDEDILVNASANNVMAQIGGIET